MNKKLLVVLGMHRSGTSLLSRSLAVLGASHGAAANHAAADNPKGFWEDADVVAFNDGLLADLGLGWFDVTKISSDLFLGDHWQSKRAEAKALMIAKLVDTHVFALKDPRLCRLLPFWRPIWEELELDVRYLLCLREPEGVMQSLKHRNQFAPGYAAALWFRYTSDALVHLDQNNPALLLTYEKMLLEPQASLRLAADHCGAKIDTKARDEFVDTFISPDLNHGVVTSDSPLFFLASECYESLNHGSLVCSVNIDAALLDRFNSLVSGYNNEARDSDALHQARSWNQLGLKFEQDIFDLNSQIPRLDSDIEELRKQSRGEVVRLDTQLCELDKVSRGEVVRLDSLIESILQGQQSHSSWLTQIGSSLSDIKKHYDVQLADIQAESSDRFIALNKFSDTQTELLVALQKNNDQLQYRVNGQEAHINRLYEQVYWKRRLIKRLLVSGFHYAKPLLRKVKPFAPTEFANRIKWLIDNRLLRPSTYVMPNTLEPLITGNAQTPNSIHDENISMALEVVSSGFDVIVFPVIDWAFRVQRPQHLAREFGALGHRVFYLTTTFHPSKKPGFVVLDNPAPNVFICQLNLSGVHPVIYQTLPDETVLDKLKLSLDIMRNTLRIKQSVSIVDLPFWHTLVASMPANYIVYDCMDYHPGFSTNSDIMHQQEQKLLHDSDLVITTSGRLSDYIAEVRENCVIRNGAEVAFFSSKTDQKLYSTERRVVGYYGAISEWFDMDLVIASAQAYPEWDFLLVGSTFGCDISEAEKISNIHFAGEVPYKDLLGYLNSFDICTIPFKLVELTLCTNPVKVYEYLAAGKPVVATAMPEVVLIDNMVHIGKNKEHYLEQLAIAMAEVGDDSLACHRSEWANQHDWKSRADQLTEEISKIQPKVSIIVLTYNNLELTKACLHSIEKHSHYPNMELILVDNASSDDTPLFLTEYAKQHENVIVCLNKDNLGFSAGNNIGLKVATGDYIVILNNDTYVTDGWLHGLVRGLRRNPNLGLVGPVTNNIGNEAKISINYSNMDEMAIAAREWTRAHVGQTYPARAAAFFCVMLSRTVYEKVGLMEEAFGVGFFEDDDYCNRVRDAGYEVAIVEDVFVHHHLSASFNKLKAEKKQELFERNKVIYEEKWGAWIPHKYRPGVH
ncbi:glycosyltransferase [Aeromonas media]|uniref:glycosyltransferase n=1 Tax=Aeromonas media TaxID=651 RepID=UPI000AB68BDB|nr:glycosyltransferase [Aeromonas media]